MRRWILVSGAVLAAVGVAAGAFLPRGEPAFASARQAREQEIPGTWGLVLRPPAPDFTPDVTPQRAWDLAVPAGAVPPGEVLRTLALVPRSFVETASGPAAREGVPAWVFVFRHLCFAAAKGELVSSSRRDPSKVPPRCTESNLWVEVIDARTGRMGSVSGYDGSGAWTPALAGGSPVVRAAP